MISLIGRAKRYASRLAVSTSDGDFTYADLLAGSARVAAGLLTTTGDLAGGRVAYLVPPVFEYPAVQWGIWRAGGVAVPLCTSHPEPELQHVIDDCEPRLLVASKEMMPRLAPIARRLHIELRLAEGLLRSELRPLPAVLQSRPAMIIYTSGTTGGPKGVVTTHDNIEAQVASLVEAWEWREDDRILLVLPLHHVHGIINVLSCALFSGAAVEMLPRFDSEQVWRRFASSPLTLFMAVPTIRKLNRDSAPTLPINTLP